MSKAFEIAMLPLARVALLCTMCMLVLMGISSVFGQEPGETPLEDVPIIEEDPYDLLTVLDAEGKEITLKLLPVEFPGGRRVPIVPAPESKLQFRLMDRPLDLAEIVGKDVIKLELYEDLVMRETQQMIDNGQFDDAYDFLTFLFRYYSRTQGLGLEPARQKLLYLDATKLLNDQDYHGALAIYEELHRKNARYTFSADQPTLKQQIGKAVDQITAVYVAEKKYTSTRDFIRRIAKDHGNDQQQVVNKWRDKLIELANEKKAEAERLVAAGEGREAHRAVSAMLNILPTLQGGKQLEKEITEKFPLILVGVSQPVVSADPRSLDNWSSRRVGRLTRRMLVDFVGQGIEGGQYVFSLGTVEMSEDGRQLTFTIRPSSTDGSLPPMTGYDVANRLMSLADPRSKHYIPAFSRIVDQIRVDDVYSVHVDFRYLHVLPEAYLRVLIDAADDLGEENGPYVSNLKSDGENTFLQNPKYDLQATTPRPEIVEVYMRDSQEALDALRRGELDVIDQVFPADVDRLKADPNIDVQPYGLPTLHMLVPNKDNEFLNNLTFRLALVYGINRNVILNQLLLNNRKEPGCRLISGPFPPGATEGDLAASDAVGYAYDSDIGVRSYEPRLASTRVILATRQLEAAAEKLGKDPPKLTPLTLAHPAGEVYKITCQAIVQSLQGIGVEVQLKELPPGVTNDPERKFDLLYVEAAVWEPLIDARRVVGPEGFAAAPGAFINLALRRLDGAADWSIARRRLWNVHTTVHQDATVIPLWQMVNYYARRNKIRNLGNRPLTLYDNITQWQVVAE